jgi:hypothetical protein
MQNQEAFNISEESLSIESTRKSKRKVNQRKAHVDEEFVEDNYFENLNLSSRLKVQLDKPEKIFFICYLCDKQFLSKEILKEHMQSHEEVRKTLTYMKTEVEKPESPINSASLKSPSSGKHPNTCPHCGKEYLYIISYNKHLKQHEKSETKDELMPLEVSFHEDDDALNFQGFNDNPSINSDSEESEKKNEENTVKEDIMKCNTCNEKFDTISELKTHGSKHVVEDVITEEDIKSDIKDLHVEGEKNVITYRIRFLHFIVLYTCKS